MNAIFDRFQQVETINNMKNKLLFGVLFFIGLGLNGQELYDPQTLYDAPGGVFDINFVREMDIVFEDPNYHNVLVNSF